MKKMNAYRLLDLNGNINFSGEEAFCHLMQFAIEELVQRDFKNSRILIPFKLDPMLATRAYEEIKNIRSNDIDGQKIQETIITSILKSYLEDGNNNDNFFLALSDDISVDSIILQKSIAENKYLPNSTVTVYPFQIKEIREQGDLIKLISSGISEAKVERLTTAPLFEKFKEFFNKKILGKGAYQDTILLLFMRTPSFHVFNTYEVMDEFKKMNNGYFKNIWLIVPIEKLVNQGGKEELIPKRPGMNFNFYVKELISSPPDYFKVISMGCRLKKAYLKRSYA